MFIKRIAEFALMFVLGAAFIPGSATAKDITLRFSTFQPHSQWYVQKHLLPLFADIAKVTEGRVKVELLPKVVGSAISQYDVVRDGLVDMAYIIPSYTPGRFALVEMAELPGAGDNPAVNAETFVQLYRKHFEKFNEFGGVKPIAINLTSPVQFFNSKRSIKNVEDFKGLKLRSPGQISTQGLTLLGGVPILKSSAEAYEMLQTGVIDGQMTVPAVLTSGNTLPLTKFATIVPGGLGNGVAIIGVNAAKWAEISEKDRAAIEAISFGPLARSVGITWQLENDRAMDAMKTAGYGIQIVDRESALFKKFEKTVKPLEEQWLARAKKTGIANAEAVLNEYRAATRNK